MYKLDKNMKPWDWTKILNQKLITLKEIKSDYENNEIYENQFNPYLILLAYSNSPYYNMIVEFININFLNNPNKDYIYNYLYYAIPKNKNFIKWTKSEKEKLADKLILNENDWNRCFSEYPFHKIDKRIMKEIQEALSKEFKEINKLINNK
jgi:hypothetical protein